jgi:outer membrane lipoprotein-sorting protein
MRRSVFLAGAVLAVVAAPLPQTMAAVNETAASPRLTASEIVEKNVAARGGLAAWRAVQTLSMTGSMEAGGKENPALPFMLEMKRPHKTRLEIEFAGKSAVQVYDGNHGWKVRPFLGRNEVESFTPDELKAAAFEADLDGILIDYAAKGERIDLVGVEKVNGRDAYHLKVARTGGNTRSVWVDAETFLEAKIEGLPRRLDGKDRPVEVALSDYRPEQGLVVPHVLETTVVGMKKAKPRKITIDSVVVNPGLDESRFAKPE